MPLDTAPWIDPEAEIQTKPDLSRPSLEGLAWLLRHPEEWPPSWRWEFHFTSDSIRALECGTAGCAIGIAGYFWSSLVRNDWADPARTAERVFGVPFGEGCMIFSAGMGNKSITPSIVASRIDDYLAGHPIRYLVEGDRS